MFCQLVNGHLVGNQLLLRGNVDAHVAGVFEGRGGDPHVYLSTTTQVTGQARKTSRYLLPTHIPYTTCYRTNPGCPRGHIHLQHMSQTNPGRPRGHIPPTSHVTGIYLLEDKSQTNPGRPGGHTPYTTCQRTNSGRPSGTSPLHHISQDQSTESREV